MNTDIMTGATVSLRYLQLCLIRHLEAIGCGESWDIGGLPSFKGEGFTVRYGFHGVELRVSKTKFAGIEIYSMTSGNKILEGERIAMVKEAIRMIQQAAWEEMKPE